MRMWMQISKNEKSGCGCGCGCWKIVNANTDADADFRKNADNLRMRMRISNTSLVCMLPYERKKYKQYTNVCRCFGKRLFHTHNIRVTKFKANPRISERERERERFPNNRNTLMINNCCDMMKLLKQNAIKTGIL